MEWVWKASESHCLRIHGHDDRLLESNPDYNHLGVKTVRGPWPVNTLRFRVLPLGVDAVYCCRCIPKGVSKLS